MSSSTDLLSSSPPRRAATSWTAAFEACQLSPLAPTAAAVRGVAAACCALARGEALAALRETHEGILYWRERCEASAGRSRTWELLTDWVEGGGFSSSHAGALTPAERWNALLRVRDALEACVGALSLALGDLALAETTAESDAALLEDADVELGAAEAPPETGVACAVALLEQLASFGAVGEEATRSSCGDASSLPALASRLSHCIPLLPSGLAALRAPVLPLRARPGWQRYWWRYALAGSALAWAVKSLVSHRKDLTAALREVGASLSSFGSEHVIAPITAMVRDVFESTSRTKGKVADARALEDARRTLAALLAQYYSSILASPAARASLSPEVRDAGDLLALAAAGDMRAASDRLVAESAAPLRSAVMGDLPTLLLLQIAFIKKEVLSAMSALDAVLAENRFNLAVAATMPALLAAYGLVAIARTGYATATAPIDTSDARVRLRHAIRDAAASLATVPAERCSVAGCAQYVPSRPAHGLREATGGGEGRIAAALGVMRVLRAPMTLLPSVMRMRTPSPPSTVATGAATMSGEPSLLLRLVKALIPPRLLKALPPLALFSWQEQHTTPSTPPAPSSRPTLGLLQQQGVWVPSPVSFPGLCACHVGALVACADVARHCLAGGGCGYITPSESHRLRDDLFCALLDPMARIEQRLSALNRLQPATYKVLR